MIAINKRLLSDKMHIIADKFKREVHIAYNYSKKGTNFSRYYVIVNKLNTARLEIRLWSN